jgi:hypothetical protein
MTAPMQLTPLSTGQGLRKFIAMAITMLLVGTALYASRSSALSPSVDDQKKPAATSQAVASAQKFLEALETKQQEQTVYEYGSAKKPNWSNLPVTMVPRNGIRIGDLTKEQRTLAMNLMAAVLSKSGYQKVVDIMDGDQQLVARGGQGRGGNRPMFGADQYYLAIFGKPSETKPWMVQFGGHHLGVNVTVIGKNFVLTPTHTGAQPEIFKRDGKDVRPLGVENDTAFKLVNALDEKQQSQAIISARPQQELLLGPGRDGKKVDPEGIKGSALNANQQALLLDLISAWVNIVEADSAATRMAAIKDKIGETYFAWKGPTTKGSAVYFRVQGPTVVIEYAPQGGTDHIHTVIRNPLDDYGAGER